MEYYYAASYCMYHWLFSRKDLHYYHMLSKFVDDDSEQSLDVINVHSMREMVRIIKLLLTRYEKHDSHWFIWNIVFAWAYQRSDGNPKPARKLVLAIWDQLQDMERSYVQLDTKANVWIKFETTEFTSTHSVKSVEPIDMGDGI